MQTSDDVKKLRAVIFSATEEERRRQAPVASQLHNNSNFTSSEQHTDVQTADNTHSILSSDTIVTELDCDCSAVPIVPGEPDSSEEMTTAANISTSLPMNSCRFFWRWANSSRGVKSPVESTASQDTLPV